ncbi:hypothetical protein EON65_24275 [archaeon]|nr:MAG: hypothetical protein EON65_24275 [archaeon]
MSLSAWTTQYDGGSFAEYTFKSGNSYKDWFNNVCESYPYAYLSPFYFTYTSSSGPSGSKPSYCPWPEVNSIIRLVATVMSIVTVGLLFIKTPLSIVARPIYAFYALLFFAIFVLDTGVQAAGLALCQKTFVNTLMGQDMAAEGMTLTCSAAGESVIVVFDVIASGVFFVLHSAWALTTDLYVDKNKSDYKMLAKKQGKAVAKAKSSKNMVKKVAETEGLV